MAVGALLIYRNSPMLHVPLAVNINHPFMSDAELGHAVVMVRFSDRTWGYINEGRVRLAEDELVGGSLFYVTMIPTLLLDISASVNQVILR